jgi:hypothetical protein
MCGTCLDFWGVGAFDIGQWAVVEFLLQSFREQDSEFGVVDELRVSRRYLW